MKNLILHLVIIIIFICCQKYNIDTNKANNDNNNLEIIDHLNISNNINQQESKYNDNKDLATINILNLNENIDQLKLELKETQEIINIYSILSKGQGQFAFQIDGNFTGSGNKESLAFYEYFSLICAFCFVFDSNDEKIESVYKIEYSSLEFNERDNTKISLDENLGNKIIWKGNIIGRFGDFNNNGRDELYLYYKSGMNRGLSFIEFNESEFIEILNIGIVNALITNVVPDENIIKIQIEYPIGDSPFITIANNSYKWVNSINQYELLSTESKLYQWSGYMQEYEEVNSLN